MTHEPPLTEDRLATRDKVAFLRRPESYPEGTREVEVEQTHMSRVFLTDRQVYKMKKPVRTPFLDFSTLERPRRPGPCARSSFPRRSCRRR